MKTISDTIFEIIREKKMTQKELAGKTGIAESTISDWKKKKNNPSADKILIICEVLEVSPYRSLRESIQKRLKPVNMEGFSVSRITTRNTCFEQMNSQAVTMRELKLCTLQISF